MDFTRLIKDDVTYWPLSGTNAQGFKSFGTPKLLKGRWEDRNEQTTDDQGAEIVATSRVYLLQTIDIGSYLHRGDKTSVSDPTTLADAKVVVDFRSTPPVSGEPGSEAEVFNRALLRG